MAAPPPDLNAILAALAPPTQHAPPPQLPPGFPGAMPTASPPTIPGYNFPQPTNSGSLDLSAIKPVSSGSVSIQDALAKARGFAAQKGLAYEPRPGADPWSGVGNPSQTYAMTAHQEDPRLGGRAYRRSRSRSRSPQRRDATRDGYNPYRDERRDERRGGGYGRERSRSPPRRETFSPLISNMVILIDSSLVGLVIGRQGESLRRIEQESGTRIQFINGPEAGPQRQCRITGNSGARISAKREINRIIEENGGNPARETGRNARPGAKAVGQQQPALREGEQSSQIMVPDRTVGLIIGRGGETIRDLQERSGCHVNIVGENKSVNGLRPVNLIGSPAAAAHAKELIMEIVDSDTKQLDGSTQAQQPQQPQQNNKRENFDPYSGGGGTGAAATGNKINDNVFVPSDAVGMIIGKGGETIKQMQSETGCKINVSQASGADIEREIGLVGTRQAIDDAKRAIWEKVDQVKEKNNSRRRDNGNANGGYDNNYSQQQQPPPQAYGGGVAAAQPPAPAANPVNGAADPYAVYGGYQNYIAMWYASFAQQSQQGGQPPQGSPGA
ncbi:hypothetical protein GQ44DRAFT_742178 [Phaeosphaeriaceae sp. PMI808]|nr:hypothetical protein GQ44DRAFT_742178 [Phaeosphaeriaceae sp. PMI808]